MFKQPLSFIDRYEQAILGSRKHTVLFHEEPEYASAISFRYLKNGLQEGLSCGYVSEEDLELVEREMSDNEIDVEKYLKNRQLWIYHSQNLADFVGGGEKGLKRLARYAQGTAKPFLDRLVLKCMHRVKTQEDIRANIKLEHRHHLNFGAFPPSLVVTYYVEDIMRTVAGEKGVYSEWMTELLENYDAVIFARKAWKGVAFNLATPNF